MINYNGKDPDQIKKILNGAIEAMEKAEVSAEDLEKHLAEFGIPKEKFEEYKKLLQEITGKTETLEEKQKRLKKEIENFDASHVVKQSEAWGKVASSIGSAAYAMQSIRSIIDTWTNPDMSVWDKLLSTMMSITFLLPSLKAAWSGVNSVIELGT
jgi:phosphotransacetylase